MCDPANKVRYGGSLEVWDYLDKARASLKQ